MINSNISMEEDTELRDLVVQTLENNGILAKVRAELRAGVFLTLEEQESVLNQEPFLNKSVKQCLSSSEGKLLFSLVREFLEYFGLDYTLSVFDPETYCGKEYNYDGRQKLSQELGINSKEPLLGVILKNTINSALNKSSENASNNIKLGKTNDNSEIIANTTFDLSVPRVLQNKPNLISNKVLEKFQNDSNINISMNVITDETQGEQISNDKNLNSSTIDSKNCSLLCNTMGNKDLNKMPQSLDIDTENGNESTTNIIKQNLRHIQLEETHNKDCKKGKGQTDIQLLNNMINKIHMEPNNSIDKTVYFDEIIVDGTKEKVITPKKVESSLSELPQLSNANNSTFNDLPPLNGQKANMNDLKELINIAEGVSMHKDNLTSSETDNTGNQNPSEASNVLKPFSKIPIVKQDLTHNSQGIKTKLSAKHLST